MQSLYRFLVHGFAVALFFSILLFCISAMVGILMEMPRCYSVETIKGKNYIATDLVKVRVVDCD